MNKFLKLAATALVALSIWACVDNANKPANSNTGNSNTNSNATANKTAPTTDALMALDKQANEAFTKGDGKFFEGFLSDKFAMSDMGKKVDKAGTVKMISDTKCDVKSMSFDEAKSSMIDADTAVLVYKTTTDGSCNGPDGKPVKLPSPVRAASVYVRNGEKWQGVWHGETAIVDPKNPPKSTPPPPPAKADDKMASNSNSNSNSSAAPASDASTDAMVAVEKAGWQAWQARDAAKLGEMTTKDLSFVDLFGNYSGTKDETIKSWTGGKCEIKSTNITDTSGVSLSPTVGFIMFKGSADGTCEGMKIMPVWGTSVYVKEGDTWKMAFNFESPAS